MPKVGPPADSRDEFAADSPLQRRVSCEPDLFDTHRGTRSSSVLSPPGIVFEKSSHGPPARPPTVSSFRSYPRSNLAGMFNTRRRVAEWV
jgi:hypothetical protein